MLGRDLFVFNNKIGSSFILSSFHPFILNTYNIMKNLIFILTILFSVPNFAFAAQSSSIVPIEQSEKKPVKKQKKAKKADSPKSDVGAFGIVMAFYFVTFLGVLILALALTIPAIAAILLWTGFSITLLGVLLLGLALRSFRKYNL